MARFWGFASILVALLVPNSLSFTLPHQKIQAHDTKSRIPSTPSLLFGDRAIKTTSLSMTDDAKDQEETEPQSIDSVDEEEDDAEVENKSFAKSMLLTVPLFLKFAAVLMIKFVTDLIVFPLLFLYRLAGVGKRKLLKKLSADPGDKLEKVNGE